MVTSREERTLNSLTCMSLGCVGAGHWGVWLCLNKDLEMRVDVAANRVSGDVVT